MANVQIDNGKFTQIAHEILENIAKAKLNGTQYAIIITIWRYTYGFKRTSAEISISFLVKATGYSKTQIQKELTKLFEMKILFLEDNFTYTKPKVIKFNKDYDQWEYNNSVTVQQSLNTKHKKLTGSKEAGEYNNSVTVQQSLNTPVQQSLNQERKSLKKDLKDIVPYKEIIEYLNLKTGKNFRHTAESNRKWIRFRWNEGNVFEHFKTVINNKVPGWLGTDQEIYLRPETLFGNKFDSYLNERPLARPIEPRQKTEEELNVDRILNKMG